jgi:RimJ/RimL family protein N-acetyltransferase
MTEFRKLRKEDLLFFLAIRNECAKEFLHNSNAFTLEDAIQWFESTSPNYWIIEYEDNDIGYFRTSNYCENNKNLYIGADLHKNYRGKGLGYLSYKKFLPYIFKEYDLHKVSLEVLDTNVIAKKLYRKIGFVYEGTKREEVLKNGVWTDSIVMSIIKDEL